MKPVAPVTSARPVTLLLPSSAACRVTLPRQPSEHDPALGMEWALESVAPKHAGNRQRMSARPTVSRRDDRPQARAPARVLDRAAAGRPRAHRARAAGRGRSASTRSGRASRGARTRSRRSCGRRRTRSRINLATGIAQMSARSPVTMAMHAMTLDALSDGRFRLGHRRVGPAGGRGLVRAAVRAAARPHPRVHRHPAPGVAARGAGRRTPGRTTRSPTTGRARSGSASRSR